MSSRVAAELGTGSSFNRTRGGVSARRAAIAATTGAPTTGAPDSRLRTLPLEQLVPTRFNPRRNFGTEDELRDFGLKLKKKQLQPAVAVTRDAYLALWPDEVAAVGSAIYVIANGERRYRGSKLAGLGTLEVIVDDELAKSRADFLDAVLSENNDREDLNPVEQALGIKTMVEQLGGQAKVAEHYGKSAGWVTQQMYLLELAPELQDLVSSGDLPVRETRALAKLPPDEQVAAWEARHTEREKEKAQPKPPRKKKADPTSATSTTPQQPDDGSGSQGGFTAVKAPAAAPQHTDPADQSFTAVKQAGEASENGTPEETPSPREAASPTQTPSGGSHIDGSTPQEIVDSLVTRLSPTDLRAVIVLLLNHVEEASSD